MTTNDQSSQPEGGRRRLLRELTQDAIEASTYSEARAELIALITRVIRRPCERCRRVEPATTGDDVDCPTCLDTGSIGPVYAPADAEEYAGRILDAVLPAARRMWFPPGTVLVSRDALETKLNQRNNHAHTRPGIWDDDNPPGVAGTRCRECAAEELLRTAIRDALGDRP